MKAQQSGSLARRGWHFPIRAGFAGLLAGGLATPALWAATKPVQPGPELRLTFEQLGIPGLSANFLAAGSSMLTVHFVDGKHLLVTYGARDLVPRIPGDPTDDDDRIVAAELVELPAGKVLARTRWHLHDHGRYLWNLGEGRFLLREGGALFTFAPLANPASKEPFARTPLPHRRGILDAVILSADGKLLTLESHMPLPKKKLTGIDINILTNPGEPQPKPPLHYDFFRLSGAGAETSPLRAVLSGSVMGAQAVRLPMDGDGYLVAGEGKRGQWTVDFQGYGAKSRPVGAVVSGCPPALELISPTQWLAFVCRGAAPGSMTVVAYDFARHEIWEEPIGTAPMDIPAFSLAPAASRFAMSRILDLPARDALPAPGQEGATQEVRVYGTQTGDLLLKVNSVPVFRTGENFDLSSDGMRLAIVRNGALEIFKLPELTAADRADLADLAKLTPPPASGAVDLSRLRERGRGEGPDEVETADTVPAASAETVNSAPGPSVAATLPAAPVAAPPPVPDGEVKASGDDHSVRRKPPSLLNPGEKAEIKAKPNASQPN